MDYEVTITLTVPVRADSMDEAVELSFDELRRELLSQDHDKDNYEVVVETFEPIGTYAAIEDGDLSIDSGI